ncbi:MAG: C1 family peptidase [Bacteroidia bacterium]|nr:C1 family peptidase [Bacteroidia bacterium]
MTKIVKKLGWVKDYPDIRDYHPETTRKIKQGKVQSHLSIAEILQGIGILERGKKALPEQVDNRKWCSPIKDQGGIGSCTAFAAIGMYEYFQIKVFDEYIDGSELFLYKATRNMLGWGDVDSGAYMRTAMGALVLFGVPPAKNYPYETDKYTWEPPAFVYSYAQNFQTLEYYRLDPLGTSGRKALKNIKSHVAAGIPVMMGFTCYTSLGYNETRETGKIPFPNSEKESVIGGHAVMIAGYDDDMVIRNPIDGSEQQGALIIRNSWGEDWGDKGYGYIPYEYVKRQLAGDFWCLISAEWVNTDKFLAG